MFRRRTPNYRLPDSVIRAYEQEFNPKVDSKRNLLANFMDGLINMFLDLFPFILMLMIAFGAILALVFFAHVTITNGTYRDEQRTGLAISRQASGFAAVNGQTAADTPSAGPAKGVTGGYIALAASHLTANAWKVAPYAFGPKNFAGDPLEYTVIELNNFGSSSGPASCLILPAHGLSAGRVIKGACGSNAP